MMHGVRFRTFAAFVLLYGVMYAAFGVASPFWPLFFKSRGLSPEQLGLLLAAGTLVRLLAGPMAGRIADMLGALRAVLAVCVALSVAAALALLPAYGFLALIAVSLWQAAALTPITTISDALAVHASTRPGVRTFEYGWVRGIGSGAFVLGTLMAGQTLAYSSSDPSVLIWLHAALLTGAIVGAALVPGISLGRTEKPLEPLSMAGGFREVFGIRTFRYVFAVSALVLGSHAMHDAFAVIRWNSAGLSPVTVSILWSEAVAAEVLVFFWLGPQILNWVGPRGAAMLAALAGLARWVVMSQTTNVAAIAVVQPFHGLTFALLHLACMHVIGATMPAQLCGNCAGHLRVRRGDRIGRPDLRVRILYGEFGAVAFLVMALLCALAIPLTVALPGRRLLTSQQ